MVRHRRLRCCTANRQTPPQSLSCRLPTTIRETIAFHFAVARSCGFSVPIPEGPNRRIDRATFDHDDPTAWAGRARCRRRRAASTRRREATKSVSQLPDRQDLLSNARPRLSTGCWKSIRIPVLTQHYAMLQRNLLYTGGTRGKQLVVLVGQKKAVAIAVRNVSGRRRWSKLSEWLSSKSSVIPNHERAGQ
jgi:UvrD-like helicase C-terminal domain